MSLPGKPGTRLRQLRKNLGLTQEQFGSQLGLQWYKIKDIESGKLRLTPEIALLIEKAFSVNIRWLLLGEGSMFISPDEFAQVPKLNVTLSAGGGSLQIDERVEQTYMFRRSWLKRIGPIEAMYLVDITGDSMEPTLKKGDLVLVDTSRKDVHEGIFAIRLEDRVLVKRIQPKGGGIITLISDNPLYLSEDVNLETEQVKIIGQVVWFGRMLVPFRDGEV